MTGSDEPDEAAKSPTQKLAELVAKRKAAAEGGGAMTSKGAQKQAERAAAARSASQSRPAPRK